MLLTSCGMELPSAAAERLPDAAENGMMDAVATPALSFDSDDALLESVPLSCSAALSLDYLGATLALRGAAAASSSVDCVLSFVFSSVLSDSIVCSSVSGCVSCAASTVGSLA